MSVSPQRGGCGTQFGHPRLSVGGTVDAVSAAQLADAIARTSNAGTRPLVLDLKDVTHLANAGVSVLYDADVRSLAHGVPLRVNAAPGSPAHQILTLVAFPPDPAGGHST